MRGGLLTPTPARASGSAVRPRTISRVSPRETVDRLTKARILDVAWTLTARDGLEGLSMRRIAAELHTGPMSLYNHVADKEAVLIGLLDRMFSQVEVPPDGTWIEVAYGWAHSLRSVIAKNRHLMPLLGTPLRPTALLELGAGLVEGLERAGIERATAVDVAQVVGRFVAGSVMFDGAAQRQGRTDQAARDRAFELGLNVLVAGLVQELGVRRPRRTKAADRNF